MTLERVIERAMIRDTSINGETVATHMPSPMPKFLHYNED